MFPVQKQLVLNENLATGDLLQLVERAKIGRLSRAGRADDADHLAFFDGEVDIL
ncbi:hypothetical protein SDC9_208757 [bioreactor metagenome]|uniref:Uncharacterized protein n=1 Tax=bioreactor metagenome TaxID=1076179 RepID=A0A645JN45_9ZZZZ